MEKRICIIFRVIFLLVVALINLNQIFCQEQIFLSTTPAAIITTVAVKQPQQRANAVESPQQCLCDCPNESFCPLARYVPREGCACCKVCLRQKGQECGGSNAYQYCDGQFGLKCNNFTNVCEGKYDLRQAGPLYHNAVTLRWDPFLESADEPTAAANAASTYFYYVLYIEATQFTNDLRRWKSTTNWSQNPVAQVSGLQVATTYLFLVTLIRNDTTLTPTTTQDAVDYARHTEVIPLRTLGCRHNNIAYRVGEHFLEGCELNCTCSPEGRWECYERKCPHFYKLGDIRDPRCLVTQDPAQPNDPCCVIYTCPNGYDSREDKCVYDGVVHELGAQFYAANCTERCYCDRLAIAQCEPLTSCEPPAPPSSFSSALPGAGVGDGDTSNHSTCFAWQIDRPADRASGVCCPTYKCANAEGTCIVDGKAYNNGEQVASAAVGASCDEQCLCVRGKIQCKSHCVEPDVPILSSNCPKMVLVNDTRTCCNKWMCSIGTDYCVKDNQMYALDAVWNDETCPIRKCQCERRLVPSPPSSSLSSVVAAHAMCRTQCPHISPNMLTSMPECLHPRIVEPEPDTCACPFVTCDPLYDEMTVDDLAYRVVSATAAEISFSLPESLLDFLNAVTSPNNNSITPSPLAAGSGGEAIKALHLLVAEMYAHNDTLHHMHRLDLPYESLLKERISYTETLSPSSVPQTAAAAATHLHKPSAAAASAVSTVVVRYVLQNLDMLNMRYSVKARLLLRDGVALPFSNEINITAITTTTTTSATTTTPITTAITSSSSSSTGAASSQPPSPSTVLYSTAAIKLVQQRQQQHQQSTVATPTFSAPTTASVVCYVPVRGVIESFNDNDVVMRNCSHVCRCVGRGGTVECHNMCWTREYAVQVLHCPAGADDVVAVSTPASSTSPSPAGENEECCKEWRCASSNNLVIARSHRTESGQCHADDDSVSFRAGESWHNAHCNTRCMCSDTFAVLCDSSPMCPNNDNVQSFLSTTYEQCTTLTDHHIPGSCCTTFNCLGKKPPQQQQNNEFNVSTGLLMTLNLLRIHTNTDGAELLLPPSDGSGRNETFWWRLRTGVRVRWNIAQDLFTRHLSEGGVVVELVARALDDGDSSARRVVIAEAHGEIDIALSTLKKLTNSAAPPSVFSTMYELVLEASIVTSNLTATSSTTTLRSNYVVFNALVKLESSLTTSPTVVSSSTVTPFMDIITSHTPSSTQTTVVDNLLLANDLLQPPPRRRNDISEFHVAVESGSGTKSSYYNDFFFNTTGSGFPVGLLITIAAGILALLILCMIVLTIGRCCFSNSSSSRCCCGGGRRDSSDFRGPHRNSSNVLHPISIANKASSAAFCLGAAAGASASSSAYDLNGARLQQQQQQQQHVQHCPAASRGTLSKYDGIHHICHIDGLSSVSSSHQPHLHQFYLKNNSSPLHAPDILDDSHSLHHHHHQRTLLPPMAIDSIAGAQQRFSTVGSRIDALNHDRRKNGLLTAVGPVAHHHAASEFGSRKEKKTTTKNKTASKNAVQQVSTTTSSSPLSVMTTPNASMPDLSSNVVYNKYASFDNLVFTGK